MNARTAVPASPARLHHAARVVSDHEANRRFLEDVLGIPLAATWCERVPHPEFPGTELEFCHTFYRLADSSCLAFFQFAEQADHDRYAPKLGTLTGMFDHTALKVDPANYADLIERARKADIHHFEIDHGYCRSLYVPSDQGYMLEFTCDPDNVEEIDERQVRNAHGDLKRWLAGDRTPNNSVRHD
jgi:catechol 2,3-dioxygenase-like lactoylglutathione lyase family enzyme